MSGSAIQQDQIPWQRQPLGTSVVELIELLDQQETTAVDVPCPVTMNEMIANSHQQAWKCGRRSLVDDLVTLLKQQQEGA